MNVGETVVALGGGRARKEDAIDHSVGVVVHHKVGDFIETGMPLFTLHAKSQSSFSEAKTAILAAHTYSDQPVSALPLFYGTVTA